MANDDRDLLTLLKAELAFLEKGGYQHSPNARWRPQFIFEDSPTCINYGKRENPRPCSECSLMNLVPEDCRMKSSLPSHSTECPRVHIDTYMLGTHEERASAGRLAAKTIERLELDRDRHSHTRALTNHRRRCIRVARSVQCRPPPCRYWPLGARTDPASETGCPQRIENAPRPGRPGCSGYVRVVTSRRDSSH